MEDYQLKTLAVELIEDPLQIGYKDMDLQQVADSLNATDKEKVVPYVSGIDVGNSVDLNDFIKLEVDQKSTLASIWLLENIPTQSGFFRDYLLSIFPADSPTQTALLQSFIRLTSRADVLGIGFVGAHHVKEARALIGN